MKLYKKKALSLAVSMVVAKQIEFSVPNSLNDALFGDAPFPTLPQQSHDPGYIRIDPLFNVLLSYKGDLDG